MTNRTQFNIRKTKSKNIYYYGGEIYLMKWLDQL